MEECTEMCSHGDLMPTEMVLPPKTGEKILEAPYDDHYHDGKIIII